MPGEQEDPKSISVDRIFGEGQPAERPTPLTPTHASGPAHASRPTPGPAHAAGPAHAIGRERSDGYILEAERIEQADKEARAVQDNGLRTLIEWVAVVVVAISAALLIKEFVFQAFEIPSASMTPTVVPGDRILVNKLSYNFGEIGRGDLVVFDRPVGTPGDTDQLIKRVIGLPGETVEIRDDGQLWISQAGETREEAELLEEPYLAPGADIVIPNLSTRPAFDIWGENCENQPREPGVCVIGEDDYLVLGDNRRSSVDSRSFGPVAEDTVVGRAVVRIWPLSDIGGL